MAAPGALEEIAKAENQMRRQLWLMAKARRGLARAARAGQGETLAEEKIMRAPEDEDLEDDDEDTEEEEFANNGFDEIEEDEEEEDD